MPSGFEVVAYGPAFGWRVTWLLQMPPAAGQPSADGALSLFGFGGAAGWPSAR
jgi:hypothetical protein